MKEEWLKDFFLVIKNALQLERFEILPVSQSIWKLHIKYHLNNKDIVMFFSKMIPYFCKYKEIESKKLYHSVIMLKTTEFVHCKSVNFGIWIICQLCMYLYQ